MKIVFTLMSTLIIIFNSIELSTQSRASSSSSSKWPGSPGHRHSRSQIPYADDILQPLAFEKWPLLAETLKINWPTYALYYYFVKTSIRWKLAEPNIAQTIYCPGGDYSSGIFVGISSFADYKVLLFAHEGFEELLQRSLMETRVIQWAEGVQFEYAHSRFYSIIRILRQKKELEIERNVVLNGIFKSGEEFAGFKVWVPEGCYFSKINASHVPLIHSLWPVRSQEEPEITTKLLMTRIRLNPSLRLFSRENDELLSSAMQSEYGESSAIQTVEKGKRKGYAKALVIAFAKELAERGIDTFGFVIKGNLPAESMFKSLNFEVKQEYSRIKMRKLKHRL